MTRTTARLRVSGQILDLPEEKDEDDIDASTAGSSGKSVVIKTTTRQVRQHQRRGLSLSPARV